ETNTIKIIEPRSPGSPTSRRCCASWGGGGAAQTRIVGRWVAFNPSCLLVDLPVFSFTPLETDFGGAAGRSELYFHLALRFTQLSRQDTQVTVAVRVGLDLGLMYLAFRIAAESNLCFRREAAELHKGQLKIAHEPYHAHLAIMIAAFNGVWQDRNEGMIVALLSRHGKTVRLARCRIRNK